jgi:hypothetical protein
MEEMRMQSKLQAEDYLGNSSVERRAEEQAPYVEYDL